MKIRQIKVYQENRIRIPSSISTASKFNPGDKIVVFNYGDFVILSAKKDLKKFINQNMYVAELLFEKNNIKVSNKLLKTVFKEYILEEEKNSSNKFFEFIKKDIKKTDEVLFGVKEKTSSKTHKELILDIN